ncbi:bacteriocin, partial [Ruminococcaceae bacterium OttesenSCG-928-A11]|nr:bacteriocin [Ruminococcaceae bacterium OttesenSCG-928-A11]
MKNKALRSLMALVLCMGAFLMPMTAFAASDKDTTPPTIKATLDSGTLHIEASDDNSGVEAVFIDSTRVNSLANGKADVILKDYAGNGKQVIIYAV